MGKLFGIIAFVCVIGFAVSLYLYTQEIESKVNSAQQSAARGAPRSPSQSPKADLKPLEDKMGEMEKELKELGTLKRIAKKETMDALMNLAVSGVAPSAAGAPAANINKVLAEQVSAEVAEAMKKLQKDLDAAKAGAGQAAQLAKELQTLKERLDKLPSSGGASAEEAVRKAEAAEKKAAEIAQKMAAAEAKPAGDIAQVKAKADQASSDVARLKADLAALTAKLDASEKSAQGGRKVEIIIHQGILDTEKDGNDIKQILRQTVDFRQKFDKIYAVNLSTGEITVRPGYEVSYFVSPADLVIPKSSVWSYRRSVCQVDDNGTVKCTVVFSRGDRERQSDEKGIVNFLVIARKVE